MELPLPRQSYSKDRTKEEQIFESLQFDSDLLLSKIEFEQGAPESPQINYRTAEAKIKELTKTPEPMLFKRSKPFCGCGTYYSCTSSLYLHIRTKHNGIPPHGTIGGPKGIVKKPNNWPTDPAVKLEEEANPNYSKFSSNQQNHSKNVAHQTEIKEQSKAHTQANSNNSKPNTEPSRNPPPAEKKFCKICAKPYSCNSSLNLHLKRKHQISKTWDGRTEISCRQEEPRNYQCTLCGLNYASKSALGLHFNNKHSSKGQTDQNSLYNESRAQRCGCNLVYQSRSALNMHVKKKHGGIYPQGTTQKANLRQTTQFKEEKQGINRIENYLIGSQDNSDEEQHSIYDSESDNKNVSASREKGETRQIDNNNKEDNEKNFKCGCGRTYTCSSSLNLHIKKNHNWVVPEGTIGGPRGMRLEEENKQASKPSESTVDRKECEKCHAVISGSYFHCKKCSSHQMCSSCFWAGNSTSEEHEWVVRGKNNS